MADDLIITSVYTPIDLKGSKTCLAILGVQCND